jgi:hypothetical protein
VDKICIHLSASLIHKDSDRFYSSTLLIHEYKRQIHSNALITASITAAALKKYEMFSNSLVAQQSFLRSLPCFSVFLTVKQRILYEQMLQRLVGLLSFPPQTVRHADFFNE